MPDYDLSSLSPRSFEQLIQAVGLKVFGPQLTLFGDGPDGGREATFSGTVDYPLPERWSGYGVVQAKFLQRPKNTKADGEWAITQLRAEMQKFIEKRVKRPHYYVFVTNVVLTPVQKNGSKDRLTAELRKHCRALKIRAWDIWDYEKIRGYLDGHRDIAIAYAAGITPGDVLNRIMSEIPAPADFEAVLSNFLQKDLLEDQYARLEQAGHAPNERILLSNVFIDVPISSDASMQTAIEPCLKRLLTQGNVRFDPIAASEADQKLGHVVIVGGPGQGKTTVGQYLCQLYRASLLQSRERLSPETSSLVKELAEGCRSDSMLLPTYRRFPVRIELNTFASYLANTPSGTLLSYVAQRISYRTSRNVSAMQMRQWLASYSWLVVLDGLDEVPASSNRSQVLATIKDFMIDVAEVTSDTMLIATTRPQGYTDDFSRRYFTHLYLTPLSDSDSLRYANRLVDSRYAAQPERATKVLRRLERALEEKAASNLMRTPLQVTIMAALVDRLGQAPDQRWELFREYYRSIYDRELERDTPAASLLKKYKPTIDIIHSRLGLLLQRESERSGHTDAHLTRQGFRDLVGVRLQEDGFESTDLATLTDEIITAASDRLVFIVGLQDDRVGFEIRSLQEFHAAEGILDGSDDLVGARLKHLAPKVFWRQVLLFAAGHIFSTRQNLREICIFLCDDVDAETNDSAQVVLKAGSILALDLLQEGVARTQPKYERILVRKALLLTDVPDLSIPARLSRVLNDVTEPILKEHLLSRLADSQPLGRLGAWVSVLELSKIGVMWAGEIVKQLGAKTSVLSEWFNYALNQVDLPNSARLKKKSLENLPNPELVEGQWWWDRGKRNDDDLESAALSPYLSVLTYNFDNIENIRVKFSGEEQGVGVSVRKIRDKSSQTLARAVPRLGKGWEAIKACRSYLEDPCADTLSSSLLELAEVRDNGIALQLVSSLSWPLRSAFLFISSAEEMRSLSSRVQKGDCGSIEDWELAEERWSKHGISFMELGSGPNDLPFDANIGQTGFPLGAFRSVSRGGLLRKSAEAIHEELMALPAGRSRVDALIVGALVQRHFWGAGSQTLPENVLAELASSDWNLMDDDSAAFLVDASPTRAISILERIGIHQYSYPLLREAKHLKAVIDAVRYVEIGKGLCWIITSSAIAMKADLRDHLPCFEDQCAAATKETKALWELAYSSLDSFETFAEDILACSILDKHALFQSALEFNHVKIEKKLKLLTGLFLKVPIDSVARRRFVYEQLTSIFSQVPNDIRAYKGDLGLHYL